MPFKKRKRQELCFCLARIQGEDELLQQKTMSSPDKRLAGILILDFPWNSEKHASVLEVPSLWYSVIADYTKTGLALTWEAHCWSVSQQWEPVLWMGYGQWGLGEMQVERHVGKHMETGLWALRPTADFTSDMFICSCQCTNSSDGAGVLHAPQDYVFTSSRVSSLLLFALLPHLNPSPHLPGVRDTVGVLSIFPWLAAFMGTLAESYVTGGQSREE